MYIVSVHFSENFGEKQVFFWVLGKFQTTLFIMWLSLILSCDWSKANAQFAALNLFIQTKKMILRKFLYLCKPQGLRCWFHPSNLLLLLNNLRMRLFKKLKPNLTEEVRILVGGGKVYRRSQLRTQECRTGDSQDTFWKKNEEFLWQWNKQTYLHLITSRSFFAICSVFQRPMKERWKQI